MPEIVTTGSKAAAVVTHKAPAGVRLSPSGSALLDAVRWSAALVVFVGHLNIRNVQLPGIGQMGHDAVCVFFVLSGFVIRFVTKSRETTVTEYSIDRVSRIYSIVLPALLFTVVAEYVARGWNPVLFTSVYGHLKAGKIAGQLLANVTWTAQCWGYDVTALINGPFWSLSYECIYYLMYALIYFRVRRAWVWVTLILLVAGPSIAFLFPIWLLGAYSFDWYARLSRRAHAERTVGLILGGVLVVGMLVHKPVAAMIAATNSYERTAWLTAVVTKWVPFHAHLLTPWGIVPWLLQTSVTFYILGPLTALLMVFGLLVCDRHFANLPRAVSRWVRTVADSTFALYLFHMPMLMVVSIVAGRFEFSVREGLGIAVGVVGLMIPLSVGLDRLKLAMRTCLRRAAAYRVAGRAHAEG